MVIVYHFVPTALPGGYIGVDVFFVLSGFLITSILLRERRESGRVSLRLFWLHRARRLLPALAAVVLVCVAAVAVAVLILQVRGEPVAGTLWGDLLVGVGAQIVAAATFTSNWLTVLVGQSYAAAGSPHLFGNLWSLAVEEQFYVLWPLVVLALLAAGLALRRAAGAAIGVAVASAVAMALLVPVEGDATRVYVGTDTHAFGLMIGAALAFWWASRGEAVGPFARGSRVAAMIGGGLGIGVLVALAATMRWDGPWAYRGGLLLASLATAAVIHMVLTLPGSGRALDVPPLRWIGERSYGLYLWHWPVLVILATGLSGGAIHSASPLTIAVASVATVAAAAASYRWLEMPVRRLGFRRAGRMVVDWLYPAEASPATFRAARRRRATVFGGTVAAVLALAGTAVASAPEQTSLEMQLQQGALAAASVPPAQPSAAPEPMPTAAAPVPSPTQAAPVPSPTPSAVVPAPSAEPAAPEKPAPAVPDGDQITMVGDSVMLGSAGGLTEAMPGAKVSAEVGKQFATGLDELASLEAKGKLRPYVVVALGTNGTVTDAHIDRLVEVCGDRPIVLVTAYGDRSWMPGTNKAIRSGAKRYDTVVLADWEKAAKADPGIIGPDGIHPRGEGIDTFVAVVEKGLKKASAL